MKNLAFTHDLDATRMADRGHAGTDALSACFRSAASGRRSEPAGNVAHERFRTAEDIATRWPKTLGPAGAHGTAVTARLATLQPASLFLGSLTISTLMTISTACIMSLAWCGEVRADYLIMGIVPSSLVSCSMVYVLVALVCELCHGQSTLMESEERVRRIAHFDALTGLPNRILLKDRITSGIAAASRNGQPLAVLFIDLDRFKSINDTRGHHVGDELLVIVGERLTQLIRDVDTVSRLGGDEFVVVLPNTGAEGAAEVADKIRETLDQPILIDQQPLSVTPSIGISLYPEDGTDLNALLRSADAAMYQAKGKGRNVYQFFRREINEMGRKQASLGKKRPGPKGGVSG